MNAISGERIGRTVAAHQAPGWSSMRSGTPAAPGDGLSLRQADKAGRALCPARAVP